MVSTYRPQTNKEVYLCEVPNSIVYRIIAYIEIIDLFESIFNDDVENVTEQFYKFRRITTHQ